MRPVWELVAAQYVGRRGLAAPWSEQYAAVSCPEGGGGDYGTASGGFDQLGFGSLLHSSPTAAVRLESFNYPGHFITVGATQSPLSTAGAGTSGAFRVRPGLAGGVEGRVSFESVAQSGVFLRGYSYKLRSQQSDGTAQFASDATFLPVAGLADSTAVSFRSHNYPDRFLRHYSFLMRVDAPVSELHLELLPLGSPSR